MKLTINTDVLKKYNLSIGEYLLLLVGYYDVNYEQTFNKLVEKGLIEANLFKQMSAVLSNNTKDLVASIITESDDRVVKSGIDFIKLAAKLQELYPEGNKPGKSYSWQGTIREIAMKLRTLVVNYDFTFTEEEAIKAVKGYVESFKDYKYMALLRNFILTTSKDSYGHREINSMFMTIIEHNRKENEINN